VYSAIVLLDIYFLKSGVQSLEVIVNAKIISTIVTTTLFLLIDVYETSTLD